MSQPAGSAYLHGTDPTEQGRLSRLNDLLNRRSLAELGLRGGERVLDVGCGLGQFARLLARKHRAAVVGVERSDEQIARGKELSRAAGEADLVEVRKGLAEEPPLRADEWGTFDVAHARFVLEHVRDPLAVVRAMVRAVRPGGRVVLTDDDHDLMKLHPEPPGFAPLWRAYCRTYDRLGNDGYIGRRLPALLHEAGAPPVRSAMLFLGSCHGASDFAAVVENLIGVIVGAREAALATGELPPDRFDGAVADLRAWADRPGAALWYAFPWAEGVRA